MSFNFHSGNLGRPRHPIARYTNFEIQDGHIGIGRQRNGCSTPDEISHGVSDFHLGITSETPQDGMNQAFAHVFFDGVNRHGEIRVCMIVVQNVADALVDHRKE